MWLDPENVRDDQVQGEISHSDVPSLTKRQRKFGFVPNYEVLRPGDLLLCRHGKPSAVSTIVEHMQRAQTDEYQGWTRAAVYVADWRIIEATSAENVSSEVLTSWVPDRSIRARRPTAFNKLPEIEGKVLGLEIAVEAALHQGNASYSKTTAASMWPRSRPGVRETVKLGEPPEFDPQTLVCSSLYARCYQIVTLDSLMTADAIRTHEPITPALLAGISKLQDVELGWLRLT